MKQLLVISNHTKQREAISEACNSWSTDCQLIYAEDENSAITAAAKNSIDIAIFDLTDNDTQQVNNIARFTYTVPYVPCLAVIGSNINLSTKVLQLGISGILERSFAPGDLHRWLTELSDLSTTGTLKGIEIHSLLQVLEGSGSTCTLEVIKKDRQAGLIFLNDGEIVSAETSELNGQDAIYEILAWKKLSIRIRYYNKLRQRDIFSAAMPLIMNALHLSEERSRLEGRQIAQKKPRLELKYFSTSKKVINLQCGSKIKIEFDEKDIHLTSTMVGSIPGQVLIISKPDGFDTFLKKSQDDGRFIVKYLNMGKLCFFSTTLVKEIDDPAKLLFLEFPEIIHYHELRKAKRNKIFIPCTLTTSEEMEYNCALIDLSIAGGMCEIHAIRNAPLPELEVGSQIRLYCLLPGLTKEQGIDGLIKNSKKNSAKINLGIEFVQLPEDIEMSITSYLKSLESIQHGVIN